MTGGPALRTGKPGATPDRGPAATTAPRDLTMTLGRLPLIGFLAVQAAIGYEWVMSGITKIIRGGFPAGLADELREKSEGAPDWFRTVIDDVLIPNAVTVGYLTEIGELLVGAVLVGTAVALIFVPDRLSRRALMACFALAASAALLAVFMNVSFHLANGSAHPWLIPAEGFDEGVDLDSLMPFIEIAIIAVSLIAMRQLRRESRAASSPRTAARWPQEPEHDGSRA